MNSLADYLADQHHVSPRTLWNWYAQYRKLGYAGLVDRFGPIKASRDSSRPILLSAPMWRTSIWVSGCRFARCMRLCSGICRDWSPSAQGHRATALSGPTWQQLPKPLLILSREGKRQFQERCEPYLLTDFESLLPNQIWVSDHGQHDVWVRNDRFSGVSANAAVRPWLTAVIDMRSRKIVGTAWSATPSSHTISSALRVAIEKFGDSPDSDDR